MRCTGEFSTGQLWHFLQRLPGPPVPAPGPARVIGNCRNARKPCQLLHLLPQLGRTLPAETSRLKPGQEYDKLQRVLDAQPSPLKQHFEEAVKRAKQLCLPTKGSEIKLEDRE